MKHLGTFNEPKDATTKVLQTLISYMLNFDKNMHRKIAQKFTPDIHAAKTKNKMAIVVFDIDDTLLFSTERFIPNEEVVIFLKRLHELVAEIHLVTARINDERMLKDTKDQLDKLGLKDVYETLSLAPDEYRIDYTHISKWKMETRKNIALMNGVPITLTVGDQWGDMLVLKDDDYISTLDELHNNKKYHFVRPEDSVSLWGLKLPVYN